jgi:hypothetical protein
MEFGVQTTEPLHEIAEARVSDVLISEDVARLEMVWRWNGAPIVNPEAERWADYGQNIPWTASALDFRRGDDDAWRVVRFFALDDSARLDAYGPPAAIASRAEIPAEIGPVAEGWANAWRRTHTSPTEANQRTLRELYIEQPQVTYGATELDQPEGQPAADHELEIVGRVMDLRARNRYWNGPVLVVERAEVLPAGPADLRIRVDTTTRRVFHMQSGEAVPNTRPCPLRRSRCSTWLVTRGATGRSSPSTAPTSPAGWPTATRARGPRSWASRARRGPCGPAAR